MTRIRPFPASLLELDDERGEAFWKGQRLELSPQSYHLLKLLAGAPDKVHGPNELIEAFYDDAGKKFEDIPITFIKERIRIAFTKVNSDHEFIKVVPRRGYKWIEPQRPG